MALCPIDAVSTVICVKENKSYSSHNESLCRWQISEPLLVLFIPVHTYNLQCNNFYAFSYNILHFNGFYKQFLTFTRKNFYLALFYKRRDEIRIMLIVA